MRGLRSRKPIGFRQWVVHECAAMCNNKMVSEWFLYICKEKGKGKGSQVILKMYNENKENKSGLKAFLNKIFKALERLPVIENQMLLLPVFAAKTTGNPHFFDLKTKACKLLLGYIEYAFANIKQEQDLSGTEHIESLLYSAGILKDNVSNMCLVYGLCGIKKDGSIHKGIEGYFAEKEPVQLTLKTLSLLESLQAGSSINGNGKIYIVENPAVFSYLADTYPDGTFICGNGQFKLAFYITLELLKGKYKIYYAGDFDADGLLIAQKLKKRYPALVELWGYKGEYYKKYLSDVRLDNVSLAKLAKVDIAELQEVKQCLLEYKRAAYQETMLGVFTL